MTGASRDYLTPSTGTAFECLLKKEKKKEKLPSPPNHTCTDETKHANERDDSDR